MLILKLYIQYQVFISLILVTSNSKSFHYQMTAFDPKTGTNSMSTQLLSIRL